MAATVRRQRPRRLACWVLMAVLLADLLALSGMYTVEGSTEKMIGARGMRRLVRNFYSYWTQAFFFVVVVIVVFLSFSLECGMLLLEGPKEGGSNRAN